MYFGGDLAPTSQTVESLAGSWKNDVSVAPMEQHALKNVNNCLNTIVYSSLETSGGQSSNLY